jgi:hypothetical protein
VGLRVDDWNSAHTVRIPRYFYNGQTQQVKVTAVGPLTVTLAKQFVQPSESVTVIVGASGGNLAGPAIYWAPDDTLPTPRGYGGGTIYSIGCGQTTCTWAASWFKDRSGRLESGRFYVNGGYVDGMRNYSNYPIPSEILWNGRTPKLTLSCAPDSIVAGQSVSCTAGTNPSGGTIDGPVWSYSPSTALPSTDPPGSGTSWIIHPTASGTVTVSATVDGVLQSASDSVAVLCNMLAPHPYEPDLDTYVIQRALRDYWTSSNPGTEYPVEQGAFGFENPATGQRLVLPSSNNTANPLRCRTDTQVSIPAGYTPFVWIHTHPSVPNKPFKNPDASCGTNTIAVDGPSDPDMQTAAALGKKFSSSFKDYVIDQNAVWSFGPSVPHGKKEYPLDKTCNW